MIRRRLKHNGKLGATQAVMVPISTLVTATPPTEDSRNTVIEAGRTLTVCVDLGISDIETTALGDGAISGNTDDKIISRGRPQRMRDQYRGCAGTIRGYRKH